VSLACCTALAAATAADVRQDVVEPYLRVQRLLADDSLKGVAVEADRIAAGLRALGASARTAEQAALALQPATSLEAAREAFGRLSDALIALADAGGLGPAPGLHVAYCPMVNKSWLQREKVVLNPYDGRMKSCGEIVRPVK
jgi:Cu(I)/Ag(I) efflux system membrane fusion protein